MNFQEWLRLKEASEITGEYWINQDGEAQFADADISGLNHEGYVIDAVHRNIIDQVGLPKNYDSGDYVDFESFQEDFVKEIIKDKGLDPEEVDENEVFAQGLKEEGVEEDEIDFVTRGNYNATMYAMKIWGWKAIRGHHVESWTLTPNDMQIIAKGIDEILEQEGNYEDTDDDDENLEFTVSYYQHSPITMTLAELRAGGLKRLGIGVGTKIQQDLRQQAAQQVKDMELQKMHPYYKEKEEELRKRKSGVKSGKVIYNPTTAALRKQGILKPGEKYGSPTSENINH